MKLNETTEGKTYLLVTTGSNEQFAQRASSIGLVPGTELKVIRNQKKTPLLIYARDTLLAVNVKDSAGIEVKEHE